MLENNNPFFSIIVPTFNRANSLRNAIESVLNQSYKSFELIIVDDGSTDDTASFIKTYTDSRIKYIYQINQERSIARNNGIENARGSYICFLDSDDLYKKNHLMLLHQYISSNNNPKELIFTNCLVSQNEIEEKQNGPAYKGKDPIKYFLQNSVVPARVCIHNEILMKFRFLEHIRIAEDTLLWASIANKYPIKHLEKHTVIYSVHENNSINIKNNCFLDRLNSLRELFKNKEISQKAGKSIIAEQISICYLGIAKHYQFKRSFIKMLKNLLLSFVHEPVSVRNKSNIYMIYEYIKFK